MNSAYGSTSPTPPAAQLAAIMTACGFSVRVWRDARVYLNGYGRDVRAYLEPRTLDPQAPAADAKLVVSSTWQAPRYNGLRCKGVKHAILKDLWTAQLISAPPPERWQDVTLADEAVTAQTIRPYTDRDALSA
ncbi:MAG: hypothetical protein ACOYM8_11050 [Caulobacterales bacterium]